MAVSSQSTADDPEGWAAVIEITSPLTGEVVGHVARHTAEDIGAATARARAAQPAWAALPFRQRARVFKRFHDLILKERDSLFDVIQVETGKSRRDAFVELFATASEARYYAYHGGRFLRPRRVKPAIPLRDRTRVIYRPVGVVGLISAWNFPFILSAGDAIPALLAGNGVVNKPASLTPLTALWARARLIEAGLPADLFQVVTGPGHELGSALIDGVDCVMFTGSTAVGRWVAERAARRLIPYSMELGGKNALLVLPDANLRHAAQVAVEGGFNNCGQVCVNWERIYVHERVYQAFVDELLEQTAAIRLGNSRAFDVDLGSLISRAQLETIKAHVKDALEKGARVLAGGKRRPDLGPLFYEPTILADVTPDMRVHDEETFGPVMAVYSVTSVEEAIRRANDSRYGLHFGVFTADRAEGRRVAARLEAGSVSVNDSYMAWAAMDAPMGGFKESGVGRRHGPEGIHKYTEQQTILTNMTGFQITSSETALAINDRLANLLALLLRVWRHIPFLR
jgi:succinate-semialdehyde dehydrogenase/glutarate-semialdehyde dehydrogenase